MYRESYQRGMLTIFYSVGSKPLKIWDTFTQDGYITRFLDQDIKSMVLELGGTNVSTTYMVCPKGNMVLGISMPFLVMVVKNLKKYFSFEVTILDDTGTRRRFRVSNFQSSTQILPLCTVMPIGLTEGWNQIQFNLAEFTRRAYKKQFVEVQKLKINANIRLRRVYFAERLLPEDQLPAEYKLFFPLKQKAENDKKFADSKRNSTTTEDIKLPDKKAGAASSSILIKRSGTEEIKRASGELRQSKIIEVNERTLSRTSATIRVPVVTDTSQSGETAQVDAPPGKETVPTERAVSIEEGTTPTERSSATENEELLAEGEALHEEGEALTVEDEETIEAATTETEATENKEENAVGIERHASTEAVPVVETE